METIPFRTRWSPTTTRSTSETSVASSTKTCAGADTRTPSIVWTSPVRAWWHTTSERPRRSRASTTVTCSAGSGGIGSARTRAAVAWLAQAIGPNGTSAASARSSGVTGTEARM